MKIELGFYCRMREKISSFALRIRIRIFYCYIKKNQNKYDMEKVSKYLT